MNNEYPTIGAVNPFEGFGCSIIIILCYIHSMYYEAYHIIKNSIYFI